MAVNLTNAEIRQFELAGITKEMIGKTIERDRAAGLSDEAITLKASAKANQLEKENPAFEGSIARGSLRTISNLPLGDTVNRGLMGIKAADDAYGSIPTDSIKAAYDATVNYIAGNNKPTLREYLEAPEGTTPSDKSWKQLYEDSYNKHREARGEGFLESYDKNMDKLKRTFQEQNYDVPKWYRYPMDAAEVIGSYGLVPEGIYSSAPKAALFSAADSYQSGIDKSVKDRSINAAVGGVTAGLLTGLANKISGKSDLNKAVKEYPLLTEGFKKNPPKSSDEALERILANYSKTTTKRADQEIEKLVSNLSDTQVEKLLNPKSSGSIRQASNRIWKKMVEPDSDKFLGFVEDMKKSGITAEDLANIPTKIGDLTSVASNAPKAVNTSGLGGGLVLGLTGNAALGPVGGIVGALLGSRGKIIPIVGDVVENISKRSTNKIASALINPKTVSSATKLTTKLVPRVVSSPRTQKIISTEALGEDPEAVKPSSKNLTRNNGLVLALGNVSEPDSGPSMYEKILATVLSKNLNVA